MRELKFRAWNKWDKQMEWADGSFLDNPKQIASNWKDFLILMQYTGLKDKNGKEIYEGDILRFPIDSNPEEGLSTHDFQSIKYSEVHGAFLLGGDNIDEYFPEELEIIGNIYENPEVLK